MATKSNSKKTTKKAPPRSNVNKKSPAKKAAPKKAPPPVTPKAQSAQNTRTKYLSNEIKGIFMLALGIFLALSFFTSTTGIVGETFKGVLMGLFGAAAYIFFVLILITGLNLFIDKEKRTNSYKTLVLLGMMLFSAVIMALFHKDTSFSSDGFFKAISSMYLYGASGYGGGILGSGLCQIFVSLIGITGTWVISIAILLALTIVLTGVSLERLFKNIFHYLRKNANQISEDMKKEIYVEKTNQSEEREEVPQVREAISPDRSGEVYGPVSNDYFNLYFSGKDIPPVNMSGNPDKSSGDKTLNQDDHENNGRKFEFSIENIEQFEKVNSRDKDLPSYNDDIGISEENLVFTMDDIQTGILTELPDENGKFKSPVQNEEGTDFEPPSLVQLKERVDPDIQAALDAGIPMDRAVSAAKKGKQAIAEEVANRIENMASESIELTKKIEYRLPTVDLLKKPMKKPKTRAEVMAELEIKANRLLTTLLSFKVEAKIMNITQGPTVTRFELQPGPGIKVSKITNLADDIALSLAAQGVRIEAPIPGKSAIGIEIPNEKPSPVPIREVIDSDAFKNFKSKTAFALGKDIGGKGMIADIADFPHILIAGATGSGKSVCINSLITSILYKAKPSEVKLIMVDPKMVELGIYNGIPHLLIPVVTDPKHAAGALNWAVLEMKNRYKLLKDNKVRNLQTYNDLMDKKGEPDSKLPEIVIIIDELADLMMAAKNEVEDAINSLAALARAAGMYLVIATQRPSVDVVTGVIKANVPSRISFAVSSQIDSRTIIDSPGAEKLLGKGDMLYCPRGAIKPMRIQGNFVSDSEIEDIINFIKNQYIAEYDEEIIEHIEKTQEKVNNDEKPVTEDRDELYIDAVEMVLESGQASVAMFQRKFKIGYQRAARLIDQMEEDRIIGTYEGTKPRQVLITRQEFNEMFMNRL